MFYKRKNYLHPYGTNGETELLRARPVAMVEIIFLL